MASSDNDDSSKPLTCLTSLQAPISPPRVKRPRNQPSETVEPRHRQSHDNENAPTLAAIEAGEIQIQDHLSFFSSHLAKAIRPITSGPRLPIDDYIELYKRNCHQHGRHFVVHQHDHPVAGVHYDLRLQISGSSSISFAIMYGLPGNPNSTRLNRNATETRVHNLWNHLIETASSTTGSMLIWDTGEYSILPYHGDRKQTDDELSDDFSDEDYEPTVSDSERLHHAFKNRKIRIRLHGTRLPRGYTLSMRLLTVNNRHEQPKKPVRKRRRIYPSSGGTNSSQMTSVSSAEEDQSSLGADAVSTTNDEGVTAYERELEDQEDEQVRLTNAYPGATNSINSIHQRKWYLSMDRYASGFRPQSLSDGTREWVRRKENDTLLGFEPFFVKGRDHERSVVTGRTADDVMQDEDVDNFTGRKGWRAVLE